MDIERREKASNLLYTINDLSESAENISSLLNEIKTNEGTARFVVHTKNGTSTTELSQRMSEKLCKEILNNYYELIRKTKDELNKVIESVVSDKAVVD